MVRIHPPRHGLDVVEICGVQRRCRHRVRSTCPGDEPLHARRTSAADKNSFEAPRITVNHMRFNAFSAAFLIARVHSLSLD